MFNSEDNKVEKGYPLDHEEEFTKWNWGAFFLSWIWCLSNRVYLPLLLVFIPIVNLAFPIIVGIKGNKWAWRARPWENFEQFKRSQRRWAIAGVIIWPLFVVLPLVYVGILWSKYPKHDSGQYNTAITNINEENPKPLIYKTTEDKKIPINLDRIKW